MVYQAYHWFSPVKSFLLLDETGRVMLIFRAEEAEGQKGEEAHPSLAESFHMFTARKLEKTDTHSGKMRSEEKHM